MCLFHLKEGPFAFLCFDYFEFGREVQFIEEEEDGAFTKRIEDTNIAYLAQQRERRK